MGMRQGREARRVDKREAGGRDDDRYRLRRQRFAYRCPRPPSRRGPTRSIGQVGAWCRARCSERIAPRAMGRPAQELLAHRREPFEWPTAGGVRLAFKVGVEPLRLANPGSAPLLARSHSRRVLVSAAASQVVTATSVRRTAGCGHPRLHVCAARQGDGKVSPLSSSERAISRRRAPRWSGARITIPPEAAEALGVQKAG
jgi:hypothetical protein